MYKKWLAFTENQPYDSIILIAIIASLIGITIEYLINRDFIGGGLWTTIALVLIQIIIVRKKCSKKK